jgi:hypothetical protein
MTLLKLAIMALMPLCVSCGDGAQPTPRTSSLRAASHSAPEQGTDASSKTSDQVVVYAWNNRADVYDLARKWAEVRSTSHLDRSTEFGGALNFCHNESLYCLSSHLEIVVPRKYPFPATWGTAGYQCRQLQAAAAASGVVKAECRLRKDWATAFEYSPERGVLRYRHICPGCGDGYYELLSKRGLFPAS